LHIDPLAWHLGRVTLAVTCTADLCTPCSPPCTLHHMLTHREKARPGFPALLAAALAPARAAAAAARAAALLSGRLPGRAPAVPHVVGVDEHLCACRLQYRRLIWQAGSRAGVARIHWALGRRTASLWYCPNYACTVLCRLGAWESGQAGCQKHVGQQPACTHCIPCIVRACVLAAQSLSVVGPSQPGIHAVFTCHT